MRKPLIYLAIAVLLAGCRGGSSSLQKKDQQNYDVVQEGQASGVTSTINAPGETVPPMTATNADTTSNFMLPGVTTATSTAPPGTIAGTLPQDTSGSMITGYPTDTAAPGQRPRPIVRQQPPPQPMQPAPQPAMKARPAPPRTDTSTTTLEGPPPSTDTAPPPPPTDTTTTTSGEKKKKDENPPPPPTQTDTQPPPTQTTTGV
jgi:hypothetical protein